MEESVVGELVKGHLGEVFDHQQLITDVSGCGNNWYVCACDCCRGYHISDVTAGL